LRNTAKATLFGRRLIVDSDGIVSGRRRVVDQFRGSQAPATGRSWRAAHRSTAAITHGW